MTRRLLIAVLLVTAGSLMAGAVAGWLLSPLDRVTYDALVASQPPAAWDDPVRFLLVRHWPCRRSELGQAIQRLHAAGAKAIGLDIALDEVVPGDSYRNEDESRKLAAALAARPGVVIIVERGRDGEFLVPAPVFGSTYEIGNAHFRIDPDGVIRRAEVRSLQGDRVIWAFGLKMAEAFLGKRASALPGAGSLPGFELGERQFRTVDGSLMIRYQGGESPVYAPGGKSGEGAAGAVFLEDWLALPPAVDASLFGGKLVLVGAVTGASGDTFRTPMTQAGRELPGVVAHGEVARTLLRGDAPVLPAGWLVELVLAAVILAFVVAGLRGPAWLVPVGALVLTIAWLGWLLKAAFASAGLVLPVANPLGALLAAVAGSLLTRRSIRASTDNALDFLREHLERGGAIGDLLRVQQEIEEHLRRYEVERAVIFTDIKGSTTFFTRYGDREGRKMVERHNAMLFPIIEKHSGHVVKTIGDAIMATFPGAAPAIEAAAAMQHELAVFNRRAHRPDDEIHIRVGVNFGKGIADPNDLFGNLVNVAARVEAQADGDQIFITRTVFDALPEPLRARCRSVGSRAIRGTGGELELFEVLWNQEPRVEAPAGGPPPSP